MIARVLLVLLLLLTGYCIGAAPKLNAIGLRPSGGLASCTQNDSFIARTSGLDTAHKNAYTTLICGLVGDGVWAKLDVFYVFATQDSTTALLNLISSSFNGTLSGSPTFTVDQGEAAGAGAYINTNFNPTTASSPNFVQNSAHIAVWDMTTRAASTDGPVIGESNSAGLSRAHIYVRYTGDLAYGRINDTAGGGLGGGVANATTNGFFVANRSATALNQIYRSGSLLGSPNATSAAIPNGTIIVLDEPGAPHNADQISVASVGGNLSATDVTNFYNRVHTYLQVIAGIS